MADIKQARSALVARVVDGAGEASPAQRRAAFSNAPLTDPAGAVINKVIDTVAKHAYKVTDEDIVAALAAGFSEDQIFEIVVCAAVGEATRQYDTAMAALDAATGER